MSKLGSKQQDYLSVHGQAISATVAGTSAAIHVYMRDRLDDILVAVGTDKPADTTTGFAKGALFIDSDVAGGTTGLYENTGTRTSCVFVATTSGLTASAGEINASSDVSINTAKMSAGTVIAGVLTAYQVSTHRVGNIIETTMYIDLAGAKGTTTDNDIIGDTGTTCTIGQITTAINGVIFAGEVHCAEVPTIGPDDINLSTSSAADGAYDADVTALANAQAIMTAGGAHAIGTVKPFTVLPTANYYLYLSSGEGGTAGTYDAGILIIKMWGLAA